MESNLVVGIDIGGSHITAALVDLESHSIIHDSLIRRPVNSKGNKEQILKEWTGAILSCKAHHSRTSRKIGIAMPGPFDYENGISYIKGLDKYDALYNLNVKELLATELGINQNDIFMMNDASCFLKGEVFGGAARDCNNIIGITLGTGLGSAVYKNGIMYDGDLYYMPYKDAAAEDYLSARWFIKRYKELTGSTVINVKEIRDRIPGDELATSLFADFGNNLGEVLATYVKRHHAEVVVIGGNIINAWELFIYETEKVLYNYLLPVSVRKAKLGEVAALVGAGSLCNA
jgi:glucokinase